MAGVTVTMAGLATIVPRLLALYSTAQNAMDRVTVIVLVLTQPMVMADAVCAQTQSSSGQTALGVTALAGVPSIRHLTLPKGLWSTQTFMNVMRAQNSFVEHAITMLASATATTSFMVNVASMCVVLNTMDWTAMVKEPAKLPQLRLVRVRSLCSGRGQTMAAVV